MKIRNKILLYFSVTSILLVGIMFFVVYWLFSEFREEDFQQRQKEKIITTLKLISEIEEDQQDLTEAFDQLDINSLIDEKVLIFDSTKRLIYSSLDDVPVTYSNMLLAQLNEQDVWIERKDDLYDVLAIRFISRNKTFYGISKAYDEFGYAKLSMLGIILVIAFSAFTLLILLISVYIANRISKPITELASLVGKYRIGTSPSENIIAPDTLEIDYLNTKFNELVKRTNTAYTFQKNSINHISHQLKTPIAVLISELERIRLNLESEELKLDFDKQISKTKSLAEIIDTLLEISKIESGQFLEKSALRVDELIFDCIDEINRLNPDFYFEVNYIPSEPAPELLILQGNEMLIKQAFQNLLTNCIAYGS